MLDHCKSKTLAWWMMVAVSVCSVRYFGIGSDLLEQAYAAPVSSSHATADMMSPVFAEKLTHSLRAFDSPTAYYVGTKILTFEPTAVEPQSADSGCGNSGCTYSFCWLSDCYASGCIGSWCASACGGSACGFSGCAGSCAGSGCLGSFCVGSFCGGSACYGSYCYDTTCPGTGACYFLP